jgi:CRP/FNR family transcriptional regulator
MFAFPPSRAGTAVAPGPRAALGRVAPVSSPPRLRRRIARGSSLYRAGEALLGLYVLRAGVVKSVAVSEDGLAQVTGFHMAGDVIGLDGIGTGRYMSDAVALEDSEVFVLPMAECSQWTHDSVFGQRLMARVMAGEIAHAHAIMIMLGTMRAGQKIAAFLMELSARYGSLGYSRSQFALRMSRQEIGSYLGLKLETVSLALSRLQQDRLIEVDGRSITLVDLTGVSRLAGLSPDAPGTPWVAILDREGRLLLA